MKPEFHSRTCSKSGQFSGPVEKPVLAGDAARSLWWLQLSRWKALLLVCLLVPGLPLASEDSWSDGLTVFGMARIRPEFHGNSDFNHRTDDVNEYTGSIVQFGLEKKLSPETSIVLRVQDSRLWGGLPPPSGPPGAPWPPEPPGPPGLLANHKTI